MSAKLANFPRNFPGVVYVVLYISPPREIYPVLTLSSSTNHVISLGVPTHAGNLPETSEPGLGRTNTFCWSINHGSDIRESSSQLNTSSKRVLSLSDATNCIDALRIRIYG